MNVCCPHCNVGIQSQVLFFLQSLSEERKVVLLRGKKSISLPVKKTYFSPSSLVCIALYWTLSLKPVLFIQPTLCPGKSSQNPTALPPPHKISSTPTKDLEKDTGNMGTVLSENSWMTFNKGSKKI